LQGRVGFVHQRTSSVLTKVERFLEGSRLVVVEDVALPVVRGRAAWFLVSEGGAPLDRQGLVSVHESFTDG